MRDVERLQHELHTKTNAFKQKVERARAIIDDALAINVCWTLSFSGGIDSTVLLDLLNDAHLTTHWGDDGADYHHTLQFLADTEQRYCFKLQRIRCLEPWYDWCVEMDRPDLGSDPDALRVWLNPRKWSGTWISLKDARGYGYGGVFLGLLADESRGRRMVTRGGTRPLYQVAAEGGMWHCSPFASWTKNDVWAYIVSRNIPYNPIYDRLAELDVPLEYRRVGPLTCFRVMQYGSHVRLLKSIDPSLYNRLCSVFPRLRSY